MNNKRIKVGLIDTGVYPHYNFELLRGYNFIDNNYDTFDNEYSHGTKIANILSDAGNISIIPLKVFEKNNYDFENVCKAIYYCQQKNIGIINFSYSFFNFNLNLYKAVKNYNGLFICSAGNEKINLDNIKKYPVCFELDNIISVNSVNSKEYPSSFSNYGKIFPHLSAIGEFKTYPYYSGTSFASASVTIGAVIIKLLNPKFNLNEIKEVLIRCADKKDYLSDFSSSKGILNLNTIKKFLLS